MEFSWLYSMEFVCPSLHPNASVTALFFGVPLQGMVNGHKALAEHRIGAWKEVFQRPEVQVA